MHPSQLRLELAAVFGEIAAARRMVAAGRPIELEGLDRRIATLCETVVTLPPSESRDLLALLDDLNTSLDQLALALKTSTQAGEGGAPRP